MKIIISLYSVFTILFASIFYISCGKEDKPIDSKNDSIKTDISAEIEKIDSAAITRNDESTIKDVKADSVQKVKVKNEIDSAALKPEKKDKVQLIAYYFHPTARCPTCINIENFTKELIQTRFEKENKEGLITFRELNIEDSLNEHYIEDYNLQFSSVILAKFVNKKQTRWKNLELVWKFANDKEQFFKYTSIEIKSFLKDKE